MNIYKMLGYIIINVSIYSYIKFFNVGTATDIQMYYFIFGVLYLFLNIIHKKIQIFFIFSLGYIGLILSLSFILGIENNIFSIIRGNFGYISFFIMFTVFYKLLLVIRLKDIEQILKKNYFLWVVIGIIQIMNNSFFTFWRNRSSSSGGRGAISFATEPAYFALTLIFISLCLFLINKENKKYIIYTLFVSLLIAKSSVGILYSIVIMFALYWNEIKKRKYTYTLLSFILIILSITYIKNLKPNSRISYISQKIINAPLETIKIDGSLRTRVVHLIFPLIKIQENLFLPNGVTNFTRDFNESFQKIEFLYPKNFKSQTKESKYDNKIVSFHGSIIYELGLFGIYIYYFIYKKLNNKKIFLIVMILGLNGLNISNPLLSLLIAISYFKQKSKKKNILLKKENLAVG